MGCVPAPLHQVPRLKYAGPSRSIGTVILDSAKCPPDVAEIAEEYSMGTLSATDAAAFEEHLLTCADCRAAVEAADQYVRAMNDALRESRRAERS